MTDQPYATTMVLKKSTKNKDVYEDDNPNTPIGTLYVEKFFTKGARTINVVIERGNG